MKYYKYIIHLILIMFLYSCGTIKEGFTNQKKTSSDEFLVEKKSPLVMPPDYNELPIPGSKKIENEDENKIKELVTGNENNTNSDSGNVDLNLENSILKKIKKN